VNLDFLWRSGKDNRPNPEKFWFSIASGWALIVATIAVGAFLKGYTIDWQGLAIFVAAITSVPLTGRLIKRNQDNKNG
jgi:hypothetical protein